MQALYLVIAFLTYSNGYNSTDPNELETNETTKKVNCSDPNERLNLQCIDNTLDGKLLHLFLFTSLSGLWVIYITFYNSRFVGLILSKIINQVYKDAHISIGSFSFSALSGKLMFRDVFYITKDYSLRVHDGYCIFRWWRSYEEVKGWRKQTDLNHGHTRLSIVVSGFEFHRYNRSKEYDRLKELFGLEVVSADKKGDKKSEAQPSKKVDWWRSLFPVIKISVSYGRAIFGNKLLPNSLVVAFSDGEFQYKTTEPSNSDDLFMHALEGELGTVRVMLVPSLGYDPAVTPAMLGVLPIHNEGPPRKMGEGYVMLQSSNVDLKYVWDEAGLVKSDDANSGDSPIWDMTIGFGKQTILNFGPWADRQRELLWNFFYPADFQHLKVTKIPGVGEIRVAKSFKFSAHLHFGADVDILSIKNDEVVHSILMNMAKGSFIEVDVPMVVLEDGYKSQITGQLLHIDVTTNMHYRSLLQAESLGFDISVLYPIFWNDRQTWTCDITAVKATLSLLFAHKDFISDLMNDWSNKSAPDLIFFVPYTFAINFFLKEFDLVLPANAHNWIDCNSKPKDNAYLGLHGKELAISFVLPFYDFLPPTFTIPFNFDLKQGQLCVYLPESNMQRNILMNLTTNQHMWNKRESCADEDKNLFQNKTWGMINKDWVPCWDVPTLKLTIAYTWHPIVATFEEKEVSIPFGADRKQRRSISKQSSGLADLASVEKTSSVKSRSKTIVTFDPTSLEADEIRIDLDMAPGSTLTLYGTLLDLILAIKENYLGFNDVYTDFASNPHGQDADSKSLSQASEFNPLAYRPLQVTVNVALNEVNGVLPIHPNPLFASAPMVSLKRLTFEMDKNFLQTRLQLLLSELNICVNDVDNDSTKDETQGCIRLTDLQFRGHAMFSGAGLPLSAATVEYAWLTEVLVGDIQGRLTFAQGLAVAEWFQLFKFLLSNDSHQLKEAFPFRIFPTGIVWDYVKKNGKCVEETDVKYLMVRLQVHSVQLHLIQDNIHFDIQVSPITVSNGNVQDQDILEAVSIMAEEVKIKQRIQKSLSSDEWMEAGEMCFGPLITQVAVAMEEVGMDGFQDEFLRFHDRKTRRLDFLWDRDTTDLPRKQSSGMTSVLESVRQMKSWGCAFFTPVTFRHPTFFYKNDEKKTNTRRRHQTGVHTDSVKLGDKSDHDFTDNDVRGDVCDVTDGNEDVFDPKLDYGMSLLQNGQQLLMRSIAEKSPPPPKNSPDVAPLTPPKPAGLVLMSDNILDPLPVKSNSQISFDVQPKEVPVTKLRSSDLSAIDRAISTESNLYRSAESDFRSNSSLSSEEFFSAESEVDETEMDAKKAQSDPDLPQISSRPASLLISSPPTVVRRLVLEDIPRASQFPLPEENRNDLCNQQLFENHGLISCYSNVLTTSKRRASEWLPNFDVTSEGIHPSVIITKDGHDTKLSRRCSMDILNKTDSENISKVILHVKGPVDIQLTPFLLESLEQIIQTVSNAVKKQHPLSVLNKLDMECTEDVLATQQLPKSSDSDESSKEESEMQQDATKPGSRIEVFMDAIRINIVQATLGNDPVFNLRLNKMLPTACITVAAVCVDRLDLKLEVRSKRKKKLLKIENEENKGTTDSPKDESPSTNITSLVDIKGHASVHSVAVQLRAMSYDGFAPERSHITALSDDGCRAPFRFNDQILLPNVKRSKESFADQRRRPPKPWGWVIVEAGIKRISADFVKYDAQALKLSPPKDHLCDGQLTIDLVWLNVASPLSASQLSRTNRTHCSWNLLTVLAPSCSAWMGPADRLSVALSHYDQVTMMQRLSSISAALTMTREEAMEVGKSLWEPGKYKCDVITETSNAIRSDPNCVLCGAIQKHFLKPENVTLLMSAVSDEAGIPTRDTLETGVQVLINLWLDMVVKSETMKDKPRKWKLFGGDTLSSRNDSQVAEIKYGGDLSLSNFLHQNERSTQPRSGNDVVVHFTAHPEKESLLDSTAESQQQGDIFFQQQQSMYSWMQNQAQNDVEAGNESPKEAEIAGSSPTKAEKKDSTMQEALKKYSNFLQFLGITQSGKVISNFVRTNCSGSLSIKAHLRNIRMDKQEPDVVYSRAGLKKHRKHPSASLRRRQFAFTHSRTDGSGYPIILCQELIFETSIIDDLIEDETKKQDGENTDKTDNASNSNNKVKKKSKTSKLRSKLSVDVSCSLALMKQRVDIALIRLVHQVMQCSDAMQQAKTAIEVNRYTAGSVSPDPETRHRRVKSTIQPSSSFVSYSGPPNRSALHRRHTSPIAQRSLIFDTGSVTSSSTTSSENLAHCWQDLYKLVDMHSTDGSHAFQDDLKFETELKRGFSAITRHASFHQPYVSMVMSGSLNLLKLQLSAEVGGLKMSTDLCKLIAGAKHTRTSINQYKHEAHSSIDASLDSIYADVTENPSNINKTILTSKVGSCRLEASTNHQRDSGCDNTCSLLIGRIVVDLPQQPALLHDILTRGSMQISTHFMEFAKTPSYKQSFDVVDGGFPSATPSQATVAPLMTPMTPSAITAFIDYSQDSSDVTNLPVIACLSLSTEGIEIGANLLPSLRAKYFTGKIDGNGVTGSDATFSVTMPTHTLHFTSELPSLSDSGPYSTSIELPPISAEGEFKQHKRYDDKNGDLQMKEGEYLSVSIRVGGFEHTLTTDLLNQLIFLQEVFVREVNDVIQKITRKDKTTSVMSETSVKSFESTESSKLLYQLQFELDGIQITASTPSSNAVRLKTGTVTFELSNRVIRAGKFKNIPKYLKLFGKAHVDLTLSLGTLIFNNIYPEAEAEFQQMAHFTTRIGFQNTTQQASDTQRGKAGLTAPSPSDDNSVILISLMRPVFFVQPTAFDKAIQIFLAYRRAYEEWTEKKDSLEGDVRYATSQVVNVLQSRRSQTSNASSVATSYLFLQLSVRDMGVCLPVSHSVGSYDLSVQDELSTALVLTIDNTLISACYANSLVTTGNFKGFCLRFADDFQTSWDDWSPSKDVINSFIVPQGTYQICWDQSYRANVHNLPTVCTSVNVVWKMKGVDMKLDTKMGMHLSHLVDTLTLITGPDHGRDSSTSDNLHLESESESLPEFEDGTRKDTVDGLTMPSTSESRALPPSRQFSYKDREKKLEQELNEQIRIVKDLRSLGAKPTTVEEQEKKVQALEGALASLFRQTFRSKLRRSSMKPRQMNQEDLKRPTHHRSVSAGVGLRAFPTPKLIQSAFSTLPHKSQQNPWDDVNDSSDFLAWDESAHSVFSPQSDSMQGLHESSDVSSSDYDSDVVDGVSAEFDVEQNVTHDQGSFMQNGMQATADMEAEVELILDIRVGIDGGKIICVPMKEQDYKSQPSGATRIPLLSNRIFESNNTTFYVPGVDVKLRYNSASGGEKHLDFFTPPGSPKTKASKVPLIQVETPGGTRSNDRRRPCLNVYFSLQTLPEMTISPCFLDFLEQTLQIVPKAMTRAPAPVTSQAEEQGAVDAINSTLASLPVDVVVYISVQPSEVHFNCEPMSRVECLLHIPSLDVIFSSIRDSPSVTSKFAFPERGTHSNSSKKLPVQYSTESSMNNDAFPSGLGFTVLMSDFSIYIFHPFGANQSSGRKDSLSVDLEVVKINLVRTRKGATNLDGSVRLKDHAVVTNISTLVDIGKASFKYDMRRLSEILAFPRAWYRRSIARRLFFGDTTDERSQTDDERFQDSPLTPKKNAPPKSEPASQHDDWQAVVLFGLNMSRLDVQMNMSNVMGNTLWSCDGLRSQGRLTLQSAGDKDIFLSCGLENSRLSAKGGIIGGKVELRRLHANCHLLDPISADPQHNIAVKMNSLDGRIEYMGSCIMMGKLTMVSVKLGDEWKGPKTSIPTSVEKSAVFVPGDVGWENFSLAISRSTTPDVIKMLAKLEEFFTQQFQNLSSLRHHAGRDTSLKRQSSLLSNQAVYAHHRHWPGVYAAIRAIGIAPNYLLGGSLCLHGNQLTIVCFHGNDFRSRSWVLFNILEPNIMFSTEVQEIKESIKRDESSTLAVQSLIFNLGHGYWLKTADSSCEHMTTVSRVTRSRHENPPPTSASIDEWFAYVTASHKQELSMLRTLNDFRPNDAGFGRSSAGGARRLSTSSNYSHETDIIFALPKLQLDFKTEHMQGPNEPDPNDCENRPVVECSFVTEFTDHICVTMDVELIMCLHDLISSYLKEKQHALSSRTRLPSVSSEHVTAQIDPIDLRQFICNTWQLEPTVRLISWAGRRIEPVGVDYILQKLGFKHARTTIPKWFQRGVLDVLDQALALIVQNLVVTMVQEQK
ncbi:bridge-like lipid transfer protein family member 1 isoform X2 [Clavelina lepadiformis]|uniref:bridge-like lipid transfer protein family member 1 isoform X2 n=1 Tax=Clavelina lepadiformis TaxID=159417 RepID=UPI0040436C36